ncbi:hypothetical protein J2S74_005393 [Evansella vedderi]|uniref:Uncharacterized protein n=1 Tax=Evansella vedderi TaxID=38282 RepID=A0ABU0A3V0_9BACI|nr:hypothetical protein [Evansella vedderi]MDQ0257930.1 hypothetical protein [Evansella vedderi]
MDTITIQVNGERVEAKVTRDEWYIPERPYIPREDITCPQCGSNNITANLIVHGFATVWVNTGDIDDGPDDCDFGIDDVDECSCESCSHEWSEWERPR